MKRYSTKLSTPLGIFVVVWTDLGISEIRIPGMSSTSAGELPVPSNDIPDWLEQALVKLSKHLEGKSQSLHDIPLDLSQQPEFHQKVYRRLIKLPPGQTVSYGQLADLIGAHGAARAVGRAMSTNPIPIVVPCHRVVKSDGSLGNYSALEGPLSKRQLLEMEGCDLSKKSRKKKNGDQVMAKAKPVSFAKLNKLQITDVLTALGKNDKKLAALMAKVEGGFSLKIKEAHSPFEAISEAIIYQQLTGKAAATILGRFKALFGSAPFPTPEQVIETPDAVLRSAGLSGAKIVALKDLADKTIGGKIPTLTEVDRMTDDAIVQALTAVKGVGTWTAHMFLMFRLGRTDVMPSGDYGVRKGFAITYGDGVTLPSPTELEAFAEKWRPYRSVASWYMWRAIEVNRLLSVPENKTVKKKTVTSKVKAKTRANATAKHQAATKPQNAAKPKAATKPKAAANPKAAAKPKAATKPKAARPKAAAKPNAATKTQSSD